MFQIDMLPAGHGDCLWISYGEGEETHRILIDGGTAQTYKALRERLLALPKHERCFELVVVTHVDADHIEGIIPLLADKRLGVTVKDIWFNGWEHLAPHSKDKLGPVQGEMLSGVIKKLPWNRAFHRKAVMTGENIALSDPIKLDGDMHLTLLSPNRVALSKMRRVWKREVIRAGLDPGNPKAALKRLAGNKKLLPADGLGQRKLDPRLIAKAPFKTDRSIANGSSIAFIAEYQGLSCMFSGDAPPGILVPALMQLLEERNQSHLKLDALKVSHHGGRKNLSPELMDLLRCNKYLISTNGSYFGHPHLESVARIITQNKQLVHLFFNYATEYNSMWKNRILMRKFNYQPFYPAEDQPGMRVGL